MEIKMKGRTLPFAVFFLFLSLFAFGEKKSYTEVITTDPLVEKGLSVSAGKRIGVWRPPTEKKELPTDRKITLEDLIEHALTNNAELGCEGQLFPQSRFSGVDDMVFESAERDRFETG